MKRFLLLLAPAALALASCGTAQPGAVVAPIPGAAAVCSTLDPSKLDIALKAYDAAIDAVNLLIDAKVLVPGSARAKAVADANDRVLAAFQAAENARDVCNASGYLSALDSAKAAIADVRAALHRSN